MFKSIKKLFEPVKCYCHCHIGGHKFGSIFKGGSRQVSCEHCCNIKPKKSINNWGTAVPSRKE